MHRAAGVASRPDRCANLWILAEAAVLFAGMGKMPFTRFILLSTLANLGVSAAYAAIGAFAAGVNSFLLAFAGAMLLPLLAYCIQWFAHRKR